MYIKNSVLIIVSIVASLSLISCSNQSKTLSNNKQSTVHKKNSFYTAKDVREVVWNQLSTADKEQIKGTWKDAKVLSKIVLTKDSLLNGVKDKSYIGKEVYPIIFPTTFIGKPNIMIVYADVKTYKFIGKPIIQ